MKVYINKYRYHWLSPYTIIEKVFFWKEIDYDTPWVERLSDILNPFCVALQKFLDVVHPKVDYVKIDPWDTWNMDYTLAKIIVPMLKQLKEEKHGIPSEFIHPRDREFNSSYQGDGKQLELFEDDLDCYDNLSVKQWDQAMDHMIWSLEQVLKDGDSDTAYWEPYWVPMTDKEIAEEDRVSDRAFKRLFSVDKRDRMKIDTAKLEQYYNQVEEGFVLFGKYYRNLWD